MLRLATLLWVVIGTALAGAFVLAVVAVPSFADEDIYLVLWAVAAAFAASVPLAVAVARAIIGGPRPLA